MKTTDDPMRLSDDSSFWQERYGKLEYARYRNMNERFGILLDELLLRGDKSKSILEEAIGAVKDRDDNGRHTKDNFRRIMEYWNLHLEHIGIEGKLTEEDVGWFMVLLKLARQEGHKDRDNLVDVAGYANCIGEILDE